MKLQDSKRPWKHCVTERDAESNDQKSAEGTYECVFTTKVLTRPLDVVVDTGASHSIIAYRAVCKLKLKGMIRASKKAFITAAGDLSFPVGEINSLPLSIGVVVQKVTCMVVAKACFAMFLGLDVLKPMGAILDLEQDQLAFRSATQCISVPLKCRKGAKTLEDVKWATHVQTICTIRPIPAHKGPLQGQTLFPELDTLIEEEQTLVQQLHRRDVPDTSKQIRMRAQLKKAKPKAALRFPEDARINPNLTMEQRKRVIDIIVECKAAFVAAEGTLPCTVLILAMPSQFIVHPTSVLQQKRPLFKQRLMTC